MRHKIAGNKLSRNSSLRKATLRDLAKATLIRQRICTTRTKAKEARKLVDQLITLGKKGTLAAKRRTFSILCDHTLVSDLFKKTSPRFKNRMGGYTRIIPLGYRRGDNADLAFLELTEKEEIIIAPVKTKKKKSETLESPAVTTTSESKTTTKEPLQKKMDLKPSSKKDLDKNKISKSFMGGLRKIFQRKAPGQ